MKNRIIVLLTAWLICCAVQSYGSAIAEESNVETYTLDQHGTVFTYLPQTLEGGKTYPLVIALNCTTGHPQGEVMGNGWDTIVALNQKQLLDTFLEHGAISQVQYDKSLGDLIMKMGIEADGFGSE